MFSNSTRALLLFVSVLFFILCYSFFIATSKAYAQTWTVEYLKTTVVPKNAGFASTTINIPPELVGNSYFAQFYVKTLPTNNNYYNFSSSNHCYPQNGGSGAFTSQILINNKASVTQTANTGLGSPTCNNSGTYYHIFRNATASTTILYVAPYYYDVNSNTYSQLNFTPDLGSGLGFEIGNTRFITTEVNGTSSININTTYYIDPSEYNQNISAYNPTYLRYWYSSTTEITKYNEPISTTTGTSTIYTNIGSLSDGRYDLLVGFTNFGCISGLSQCPFPDEYIYTWFEIQNGILYATGTLEIYTRKTADTERLPCSITNIENCFLNIINDLFIPSDGAVSDFLNQASSTLLYRAPWGYITRVYDIFTSESTSTLPSFSVPIPTGAGSGSASYEYASFNMGDMVAGGGALLDSVTDPIYGKTPRDIFYPWVQGSIALMVIMTIVGDLMRSHRHTENQSRNTKLS